MEELSTRHTNEPDKTSTTLGKSHLELSEISKHIDVNDNIRNSKDIVLNKVKVNSIEGHLEKEQPYYRRKEKLISNTKKKKKSSDRVREMTNPNGAQLETSKSTNNDEAKQIMKGFHQNGFNVKPLKWFPKLLVIFLLSPFAIFPFLGPAYRHKNNDLALINSHQTGKENKTYKQNSINFSQKLSNIQFADVQLYRSSKPTSPTQKHEEYLQEGNFRKRHYGNKTCTDYWKTPNLLINLLLMTTTCLYYIENRKRNKEKSM